MIGQQEIRSIEDQLSSLRVTDHNRTTTKVNLASLMMINLVILKDLRRCSKVLLGNQLGRRSLAWSVQYVLRSQTFPSSDLWCYD